MRQFKQASKQASKQVGDSVAFSDLQGKNGAPMLFESIRVPSSIMLKPDSIMWALSLMYIILPIIIFLAGWTKLYIFLLGSILLLHLWLKTLNSVCKNNVVELFGSNNKRFWLITTSLICLWVYLSGIGGLTFQNSDFWVRNPIYRDLCNMPWPVYYDLSQQPEYVQQIIGSDRVAFAYYYSWWLVPALISKLFHFGEILSQLVLYLWAVAGMFIIHWLLCKIMKRCTWICLVILVFFSGLDVVAYLFKNLEFPDFTQHIEWALKFFQYSSNTTQLFWVFNQSIPIWVITAVFVYIYMYHEASGISAGIGSLAFAYSPWATFGMIPLAVCSLFKGNDKLAQKLKRIFTASNILIPLLMLLVFGTFYSAGGHGGIALKLHFMMYPKRQFLMSYIVFWLTEVGFYFVAMGKNSRKYPLYNAVFWELVCFPLIIVIDGNFIMRGSIPALFILMIYVIMFIVHETGGFENKIRKLVVICLLIIGVRTPMNEINRSINATLNTANATNKDIATFSYMETQNDSEIRVADYQFFVHNYESRPFYKFIAK